MENNQSVIFEQTGNIALLTLNRPQKLNAIDYEMNDRLLVLLDEIEADNRIRAIILTGAGDRAFSAGGDIHEFTRSIRHSTDGAVRDFCRLGQTMTARLEAYPSRSSLPSTASPMEEAARSRRLRIWRWRRTGRSSPSPRSGSAFHPHLAARSVCRVLQDGNGHSSCC